MKNIKQTLFTDWHFMRWIRLAFGIFFLIATFQSHQMIMGLGAAFFLFSAITNTGCCGTAGCTTPVRKYRNEESVKSNSEKFEEITN